MGFSAPIPACRWVRAALGEPKVQALAALCTCGQRGSSGPREASEDNLKCRLVEAQVRRGAPTRLKEF